MEDFDTNTHPRLRWASDHCCERLRSGTRATLPASQQPRKKGRIGGAEPASTALSFLQDLTPGRGGVGDTRPYRSFGRSVIGTIMPAVAIVTVAVPITEKVKPVPAATNSRREG